MEPCLSLRAVLLLLLLLLLLQAILCLAARARPIPALRGRVPQDACKADIVGAPRAASHVQRQCLHRQAMLLTVAAAAAEGPPCSGPAVAVRMRLVSGAAGSGVILQVLLLLLRILHPISCHPVAAAVASRIRMAVRGNTPRSRSAVVVARFSTGPAPLAAFCSCCPRACGECGGMHSPRHCGTCCCCCLHQPLSVHPSTTGGVHRAMAVALPRCCLTALEACRRELQVSHELPRHGPGRVHAGMRCRGRSDGVTLQDQRWGNTLGVVHAGAECGQARRRRARAQQVVHRAPHALLGFPSSLPPLALLFSLVLRSCTAETHLLLLLLLLGSLLPLLLLLLLGSLLPLLLIVHKAVTDAKLKVLTALMCLEVRLLTDSWQTSVLLLLVVFLLLLLLLLLLLEPESGPLCLLPSQPLEVPLLGLQAEGRECLRHLLGGAWGEGRQGRLVQELLGGGGASVEGGLAREEEGVGQSLQRQGRGGKTGANEAGKEGYRATLAIIMQAKRKPGKCSWSD